MTSVARSFRTNTFTVQASLDEADVKQILTDWLARKQKFFRYTGHPRTLSYLTDINVYFTKQSNEGLRAELKMINNLDALAERDADTNLPPIQPIEWQDPEVQRLRNLLARSADVLSRAIPDEPDEVDDLLRHINEELHGPKETE